MVEATEREPTLAPASFVTHLSVSGQEPTCSSPWHSPG